MRALRRLLNSAWDMATVQLKAMLRREKGHGREGAARGGGLNQHRRAHHVGRRLVSGWRWLLLLVSLAYVQSTTYRVPTRDVDSKLQPFSSNPHPGPISRTGNPDRMAVLRMNDKRDNVPTESFRTNAHNNNKLRLRAIRVRSSQENSRGRRTIQDGPENEES